MTVNKRKKDTKQRGSHTHGWGSKKKHRGSGNRGGKGMAGTGKRSDAIKPSIWAEEYFGKHGFVRKGSKRGPVSVNVGFIDENAERLAARKVATQDNGAYIIDIGELGFGKLLGKGKVTKKLVITANYASASAAEAVKAAGGQVIVNEQGKREGK
ncbi:50S ribosomal protein L15 [Candidatus Woesearchaeota archaeon]|nr:50S ribosomal protein L15 [Candidatus Woesearchaeota archaeon]